MISPDLAAWIRSYIFLFPAPKLLNNCCWTSRQPPALAPNSRVTHEYYMSNAILGKTLQPSPSRHACIGDSWTDDHQMSAGDGSLIGMLGRMGYVHIDDVARAHLLVYQEPSARGRYLCSATELEPEQLCRLVAARYPHLPIPTRYRWWCQQQRLLPFFPPNNVPKKYRCNLIRKL
jgi:hypothetical protein